MGQRSQIYIHWDIQKYNDERRAKGFIARYFQWNYGQSMVSRARGIIEALQDEYLEYRYLFTDEWGYEKLCRICDTNFDMRDIVRSDDILDEIRSGLYDKKYLFRQDNNDGQLLIKIADDGIKYAFIMYDSTYPLSALQYMNADLGAGWRKTFSEEGINYIQENHKAIKKIATLMTEDEVKEFLGADYTEYIKTPYTEYKLSV